MSLLKVFDIAGSALSAQSVRLNVTASNLANADSVGSSVATTYRARQPVFQAMLDEAAFAGEPANGGVQVAGIVESDRPLERRYQPEHPAADEDGYVLMPNVSVVEEMANMISASRSYQGNVDVLDASKQMLIKTLALGQ